MSTVHTKPPRRIRVERNIYRRPDGKLEVGYRDSASKQRWKGPFDTITAARRQRDALLGAKAKGDRVEPAPRLTFGAAADRWLAEQVVQLRATTQANYRTASRSTSSRGGATGAWTHQRGRLRAPRARAARGGQGREDDRDDPARRQPRVQVRPPPLRLARREPTLAARGRRTAAPGRRTRASHLPAATSSAQVFAASTEPWTTLFLLAARRRRTGVRAARAVVGRPRPQQTSTRPRSASRTRSIAKGRRVELKTEESKATLPLPRGVAVILSEHKARSAHAGPRAFVFSTRTGRPLSQRNVLRALYRARRNARATPEGSRPSPTLRARRARPPGRGRAGAYVPRDVRPHASCRRCPTSTRSPRRGDGLRRRRRGTRPPAPQEQQRHAARSTARTSPTSAAKLCAPVWKHVWKQRAAIQGGSA